MVNIYCEGDFIQECESLTVLGSDLSPATNTARNVLKSYLFVINPSGSACLIARNAVGALNITFTPCSSTNLQYAPASATCVQWLRKYESSQIS